MNSETSSNLLSRPTTVPQEQGWPYQVLKRFRLIFKSVQQHSHWVETRTGVSSAQLWAIWELAQAPGLRVNQLAKALSIHQSTASNLLDKLAKKGLVKRERVSTDQRVVSLFLTDAGHQILARAPQPPQGILQHALFNLPQAALIALANDLDTLLEKMNFQDEQATMQPLMIPRKRSERPDEDLDC